MSERINYNNIGYNDPHFKDWERKETAGHNEINVDIDKLIPLVESHPVTQKPLAELEGQLDHKCWSYTTYEAIDDSEELAETVMYISPRAVIDLILNDGIETAKQNHYPLGRHIEKIAEADRRYPLFMYEGHVLNGMHRLAQVYLDAQNGGKQDFVTVKELKTIPEEALVSN